VPQWARPFGFQKAGLSLIPLLESTDGNLLLQQCTRPRGREATLTQFALWGQQAIRCRRAHGKQLFSALLCQTKMLMPFERFDKRGKKRDEAFSTNPVGGVPNQEQHALDFRSVMPWAGALRWLPHLFRMIEEPHRVLAIVSSRGRKGIEQLALLLESWCLAIPRDHLLK
jgi:hypothetical protein